MKIGIEVEGRLKGLPTLFMTANEALVFFNYKSLKDAVDPQHHKYIDQVRHVYVSDHANILYATDYCMVQWKDMAMPVTLERTFIDLCDAKEMPANVTIMLTVDSRGFWNLRPQDQVKFSLNEHVHCMAVENMTVTEPKDFEGDIELKVVRNGTPMCISK